MAMRCRPMLMVSSRVPTKTRPLPLVFASLQPWPFVIRSPRFAFLPFIVISPAMSPPFDFGSILSARPCSLQ